MADPKRTLIIGGGIAGLSAASYLRMNGYDTCVFEAHTIPGGVCTAWKQKGYTFDGCIHWLMGSGPWSRLHQVWDELGAIEGRRFVEHDEYLNVLLPDGGRLIWYTDIDRLEQELLGIAPEDAKPIRRLARDLRAVASAEVPLSTALFGARDWLRLAGAAPRLAPVFLRAMRTTVAEFMRTLRSERLRAALAVMFPPEAATAFPMIALLMMTAYMHRRSAGYPIGGSLPFALAIEQNYRALGGEIRYRTRVRRIIVEDGAARGVELEDGSVHRGDRVVSAADGHATLFDMLGGRYLTPSLREAYSTWQPYPSLLFVSAGIARDLSHLPHAMVFNLPQPIVVEAGALKIDRLMARVLNFDPTLAPAGKTTVVFMIESRGLEYWGGLREREPARYAAEKQAVADAVLAAFDRQVGGGIADAIEVTDVATPATWQRYTGNWQGSYEGWLPPKGRLFVKMDKRLPGLRDFDMVGQWVNPGGGLPPAAIDGRDLARAHCRRDGRKFVVRKPLAAVPSAKTV
jgi:phytoene dehydrogenase-like protein